MALRDPRRIDPRRQDPRLADANVPTEAAARRGPCERCRRWRIFLAGVCAGVIALALQAMAGPPSMGPQVKSKSIDLNAPELRQAAASAAAGVANAAVAAAASAAQAQAQAAMAAAASAVQDAAMSFPLPPAERKPSALPAPVADAATPAASATSVTPKVAGATTPTATAATAAPWPAASSAARGADLRLVYVTVPMPAGRVDTEYKRREVVEGGQAPYHIEIEGTPPPGLQFGNDGFVSGRPTRVGNFSFTLRAYDSASPRMEQEQHYVLRVLPPASATPAASPPSTPAAPATPPRLQSISLQEADGAADIQSDVPVTYLLTAKDLDDLVPPTEEDKAKPTSTAVAPSPPLPALAALRADVEEDGSTLTEPPLIAPDTPTPAQLRGILSAVVGVEYPTRAMFVGALEAERCRYYLLRVAELAAKRKVAAPTTCPLPAAKRPATSATAAPKRNERRPDQSAVPLDVFFDSLLAEDNLRDAVQAAMKAHPVGQSRPLMLAADGCQCAPGHKGNQVVGVIPFWRAQEQPIPINFNLFTRLQYMGVVLKDDGSFDQPQDWDGAVSGFSREAQRYDVAMDLVIYRRSWSRLLNRPDDEVQRMIKTAAQAAVQMIDRQRQDPQTWMNRLLLKPGADSGSLVFGGLTVFFEDTPTEGQEATRYTEFLKGFTNAVLEEMQKRVRPYYLNIVVPDDQLGERGPYNYGWLMDLKLRAEPPWNTAHRTTPDGSREPLYTGKSDVTVQYLVMMSGDPDTKKKIIRRNIDLTTQVTGVRRIDFLDSMMPVVVHATSPEAQPVNVSSNMARDFPYLEWNYGGVTLWPLPLADVGMGNQVIPSLVEYFISPQTTREKACAWVCPNRLPLRLLAQTLLLGCIVAAVLYGTNCRVRRVGMIYLLVLGVVAFITAALCLMLLTCDPAFAPLRESPYVPLVALVLAVAAFIYIFLQFRAPEL